MQSPEDGRIESPEPWLETVLHGAAHRGDATAVKAWLARGENPNVRARSTGETPLHLASNGAVASLLPSSGAKTEARDEDGETPLHTAARRRRLDVMQSLVAAGANVNAKTKSGWTRMEAMRATLPAPPSRGQEPNGSVWRSARTALHSVWPTTAAFTTPYKPAIRGGTISLRWPRTERAIWFWVSLVPPLPTTSARSTPGGWDAGLSSNNPSSCKRAQSSRRSAGGATIPQRPSIPLTGLASGLCRSMRSLSRSMGQCRASGGRSSRGSNRTAETKGN